MKVFTLISLILFATLCFAQKIDLDAEKVKVNFIQLPKQGIPAGAQTYSVTFSANPGDLKAVGLEEKFFLNNLRVFGYQKVPSGGDFTLSLNLSDYKQMGGNTKTRNETSKDKNGKESTRTFYAYEASYEHKLSLNIKDQAGKKLGNKDWLWTPRTFKSKEFDSQADLNNYVNKHIGRDLANDNQKAIVNAMKEIYNYLNAQYGFTPVSGEFKLQILDSKKHQDYAGFQTAYQSARSAFAAMEAEKPLDPVRELAKPALDYFEEQAGKYNAADKNEKKLKFACLYNLAQIHFWLENFELASKYALAVVENDYDPKDGKRLLDDIKELQADLDKSGKNSRHFKLPADAEAATDAAASGGASPEDDVDGRKAKYKDASLKLTPNTVQYDGVVVNTKGEETAVLFLVENPRALGISFGTRGNIRYAVDMGDQYALRQIDKASIAAFRFDGRSFAVLPFKSANSVNIGGGKTVLEVLHDGSGMKAYLAYGGDNDGLNNPPEYVLYDVKESGFTSLNGMKFALNLNKGVKKEYGDCPAVAEAADKGGFKKTVEDVVRLATLIESCKH